MNDRDPFIYRTTDYGATWTSITNGIPKSSLSYAKVIHEDPKRRGMLYVGTENAIYVTFDDGEPFPRVGVKPSRHFRAGRGGAPGTGPT
mgnify:CR=1 FL=1